MKGLVLTLFGAILIAGILFIACTDTQKPKTSASEIGKEVICPVTGEKFKITKHTPFVDYQGNRYYFCCPGCDKRFLENPEKYLNNTSSGAIHRTEDISGQPVRQQEHLTQVQHDTTEISYWTCSMHPAVHSDKPGKCPICGMALIPVYKGSENRVVIDSEKVAVLKIKTAPAEIKNLTKRMSVPAKVIKDEELYMLQQELLTSDSANSELYKATTLKLKQLGFSEADITQMRRQRAPDESLILPDLKCAWLVAEIYEQDIGIVKKGKDVKIRFSAFPEKEFIGTIKAIETQISPMTRSAKARIKIDRPPVKLFSEMYADVIIEIPVGRYLSIPANAIIDTGQRKVVYVEVGPGNYEMRNVITGMETEEYVQVIKGLSENEKVVTEGNFLLDSQTTLARGQSLLYGAGEEVKEKPVEHKH